MRAGGETNAAPIRVGVVDDHPVIAVGLAQAGRDGVPRVEIRAAAANVDDGLRLAAGDDLDVLICDLQLADAAEGFEVLDQAVRHGLAVIVLSAFGRDAFARAAFERGARGFVMKSGDPAEIVAAIRRVAAGGLAFDGSALEAIRSKLRSPSVREVAVIRGIAAGRTSQEIASSLGVSSRTVESHVRRLFERYGVVSRAELAIMAERSGWLVIPPG